MHEKERFAFIGMMMGGISHEIFNPLSGISGPLRNIKKIVDAGEIDQKEKLEKHLSFIKKSVTRIEQIITTMRALFQNRSLEREELFLPELLALLVEKYREETGDRIVFTLKVDPAARVRGNAFVLTRIMDNLVANCADAIEERGEISIES